MARWIVAALAALGLFRATLAAATPCGEVVCTPTRDDPHGEHCTALSMFKPDEATHRALTSGDWSDPKTWDRGVPGEDARVLIPEGITVTLSRELEPAIDWLRLEGSLEFSTRLTTRLRVATIVVSASGTLRIGYEHEPLDADRTATILFTPRSRTHRQHDPYDVSGGIIAMGKVQFHGCAYQGFAIPDAPLTKGMARVRFRAAPRGWKVGDELLFPASTADSKDERRTITVMSGDGKTVALSAPLDVDHGRPAGITRGIPVGNLTRNIVVASADPGTLAHRGHLMFMTQDGVHLSGTAFRGLGRTLALRIHSTPDKDAKGKIDTGDNLIGRYAVHFHLREGASRQREPQYFTGNVIVDSPKHGLVNHGGYIMAENNVTYAVHGSHFFSENGSEIGSFRNNLAVYSRGSGDTIRSRECRFDFGHGGHGFWAQSPGVIMEGNYAFHHADAGFSIFPRPVVEFGKPIFFSRKNMIPEIEATETAEKPSPGAIPFRFVRNAAGNCAKGLETWNVNTYAKHNVPSLIADCQFWDAPVAGIDLPYTFHTRIEDTIVVGRPAARFSSAGIHINTATKFLTLKRVSVSGYAVGVEVPRRGHTRIAECRFDNAANLKISSPVQPGRCTILTANTFAHGKPQDVDYYLAEPDCKFNGDLSLMFDRDLLLVEDARFPNQTVYFSEQRPNAVPLPRSEVEQLRGKTARQLWSDYGLAIAGSLAPEQTSSQPGVRGVVGPVSEAIRKGIKRAAAYTFADEVKALAGDHGDYTLDQNRDRVRFVKGKPGERSGWRLDTTRVDGVPHTRLSYVDATPPHFELSRCMKLEIHPDDIRHGIEICGILHDEVAGNPTIKNMIKEYRDLKVDSDGIVRVRFQCTDAVGNKAQHTFPFKVTKDAVKRGSNIGHYNQKQYAATESASAAEESEPTAPTAPTAPMAPTAPRSRRWLIFAGAAVVIGVSLLRLRRRASA